MIVRKPGPGVMPLAGGPPPAAGASLLRPESAQDLSVAAHAAPLASVQPSARPAAAPAHSVLGHVGQRGVIRQQVAEAYSEARKILAVAEQEAERIKAEALRFREEQVRAGYEEGRRQGYEEALKGLAKIEEEYARLAERIEPELVKLSLGIARKILGAEIEMRPEAIAQIVAQALKTVRHTRDITIRVHPSHVAALEGMRQTLLGVLSRAREFSIRGDESMRPGGCVIETELGTLDGDLDTQLALIERALRATTA